MNKKTLTALKQSIEHWYDNLNLVLGDEVLTISNMSKDSCALCGLFNIPSCGCIGCPVADKVNLAYCFCSPFMEVNELRISCCCDPSFMDVHVNKKKMVNAVIKEIHFLESLLPEQMKCPDCGYKLVKIDSDWYKCHKCENLWHV